MKFSLIMGSYNPRLVWFQRAMDSADGLFDEIILVNDGSAEFPNASIFPSTKQDFRYIKHDVNKGFAEAKNTAIYATTGDVICILDDDDYFDRGGVVRLKKFVRENDSDIWHFILQEFNETKGLYGVDSSPDDLTIRNSIPGVSWFKKKLWEELGGFRNVKAEDWDMWYRSYKQGKRFTYFPEIVYNFNKRSDSVSARWVGKEFKEIRNEILNEH